MYYSIVSFVQHSRHILLFHADYRYQEELFTRGFASLSGGERRRVSLAKLLIDDLDLVLLDEPTNHLDVEGVAWLADHLKNRKNLAVVVVTHDRWFLDEVTDRTWEVINGNLEEYDGGYSAYVLAKAERARQQAAMDSRRNNLLRKELAWLRRGAPARTSKPKFRVDAANELVATEPPTCANLAPMPRYKLGVLPLNCRSDLCIIYYIRQKVNTGALRQN